MGLSGNDKNDTKTKKIEIYCKPKIKVCLARVATPGRAMGYIGRAAKIS
jgi:hypothetical protein